MANKKASTIRTLYGKAEGQYLELVCQFPLRPIRTDQDLDAAIAIIDVLIDQSALSTPEKDYLDVLSDLVETYETEKVPFKPVGDAYLLRFLIEQKSVTQAAVADGSSIAESTISEVLAGRRKLNRGQIAKLSHYFHVNPGAFISEA